MGITNQNRSSDCFTFQAGLKGIRRCLWWRNDVVSLLLLMVSVFPGCFSFMRRAEQVYVLKQYIHVALRSPSYPWCGLGLGTSPCIGLMKVGWNTSSLRQSVSSLAALFLLGAVRVEVFPSMWGVQLVLAVSPLDFLLVGPWAAGIAIWLH